MEFNYGGLCFEANQEMDIDTHKWKILSITHTHTSLNVLTLALQKTSVHDNLENFSPPNPWKKQTCFQIGLLETFLHWNLENLCSNQPQNEEWEWEWTNLKGLGVKLVLTPQFGWKIEFHLAHFFNFFFKDRLSKTFRWNNEVYSKWESWVFFAPTNVFLKRGQKG